MRLDAAEVRDGGTASVAGSADRATVSMDVCRVRRQPPLVMPKNPYARGTGGWIRRR